MKEHKLPLHTETASLVQAYKEIASLIEDRGLRAAELLRANIELVFQNEEKEKRAEELATANAELVFQNGEKGKRAEELVTANVELAYQNKEKEKRAAELVTANAELVFQNEEKEKRAAELVTANAELVFQNEEKEKRAEELVTANAELAFQNKEKEKRAAELVTANTELAFQNKEKEKRAAELVTANTELVFQNEEKEKRAAELLAANLELEQFAYLASHDIQEPLRTVANYMQVFEEDFSNVLNEKACTYIHSIHDALGRMSLLIHSLLNYSRLGKNSDLENVDLNVLVHEVVADLDSLITSSGAVIEIAELPVVLVFGTEMHQLFQNLLINAIKFQKKGNRPKVRISAQMVNGYWQFSVTDNGIGINAIYFEQVFEIFQCLHPQGEYEGTGIGLANCKKIVQLHKGKIWIESTPGQGTTFYFTIANSTNE